MKFSDIPHRAKRVPGRIRGTMVVVGLILPFSWVIMGSGLYHVQAEWQASLMDGYYIPIFAWLVCTIVCLCAVAVGVHIIATFLPKTEKEIERADETKTTF